MVHVAENNRRQRTASGGNMSTSRNFMVIASLYIIIGVGIGMYMGGSNDRTLVPVHAHINLLGFVLPMVFGITYHLFPAAGGSALARAHFWLHQIGVAVLLTALFLMLSGRVATESIGLIFPVAEIAILLGVLIWLANLWRSTK